MTARPRHVWVSPLVRAGAYRYLPGDGCLVLFLGMVVQPGDYLESFPSMGAGVMLLGPGEELRYPLRLDRRTTENTAYGTLMERGKEPEPGEPPPVQRVRQVVLVQGSWPADVIPWSALEQPEEPPPLAFATDREVRMMSPGGPGVLARLPDRELTDYFARAIFVQRAGLEGSAPALVLQELTPSARITLPDPIEVRWDYR